MSKSAGKELGDQVAHALWSGASVALPILAWSDPRWGLPELPVGVSIGLTAAGVLSFAGLCFREWLQKRHKPGGILYHWPWLDTLGYTVGAAIGATLAVLY